MFLFMILMSTLKLIDKLIILCIKMLTENSILTVNNTQILELKPIDELDFDLLYLPKFWFKLSIIVSFSELKIVQFKIAKVIAENISSLLMHWLWPIKYQQHVMMGKFFLTSTGKNRVIILVRYKLFLSKKSC